MIRWCVFHTFLLWRRANHESYPRFPPNTSEKNTKKRAPRNARLGSRLRMPYFEASPMRSSRSNVTEVSVPDQDGSRGSWWGLVASDQRYSLLSLKKFWFVHENVDQREKWPIENVDIYQSYHGKWPIEIVDLSMNSMVIGSIGKSWPEGKCPSMFHPTIGEKTDP